MRWRIRKRYWFKKATEFFLACIVAVLFLFAFEFLQRKPTVNIEQESLAREESAQKNSAAVSQDITALAKDAAAPAKEETAAPESETPPLLSSENYQITQLSFSGNLVNLDDTENIPLELSDIRGEAGLSKDEKEARIFLSWKTNKLAVSKIEYSKGSEVNKKTIQETEYGFQHSIIISGLDIGSAYTYTVTVKDHWGNIKTSGYYGVYTGTPKESVFRVISDEFNNLFGWMLKK